MEGRDPRPRRRVARHLGGSRRTCSPPCRSAWRAKHRMQPGAASSRGTSTASSCWRSIGATARSCGSASPPRSGPTRARIPINGTWASSSAVTDGEHVIAFFESRGLYAYDINGKLLWQKRLRREADRSETGEGTTPALYGNYVILVWDHQGESFIVVLDKRTGRGDSGGPTARKPTPGRRRLSSSTTDARRSSPTAGRASAATISRPGKIVWHTTGIRL